ncbi:MAG TPA: hypothetical protein PK169_04540, partial [Bacilli bacterium]|nr:hypothetical protein [Bacilli bacterium]
PKKMSLENYLEFINDDEMVEITRSISVSEKKCWIQPKGKKWTVRKSGAKPINNSRRLKSTGFYLFVFLKLCKREFMLMNNPVQVLSHCNPLAKKS